MESEQLCWDPVTEGQALLMRPSANQNQTKKLYLVQLIEMFLKIVVILEGIALSILDTLFPLSSHTCDSSGPHFSLFYVEVTISSLAVFIRIERLMLNENLLCCIIVYFWFQVFQYKYIFKFNDLQR